MILINNHFTGISCEKERYIIYCLCASWNIQNNITYLHHCSQKDKKQQTAIAGHVTSQIYEQPTRYKLHEGIAPAAGSNQWRLDQGFKERNKCRFAQLEGVTNRHNYDMQIGSNKSPQLWSRLFLFPSRSPWHPLPERVSKGFTLSLFECFTLSHDVYRDITWIQFFPTD
jgi:hypothetical protein